MSRLRKGHLLATASIAAMAFAAPIARAADLTPKAPPIVAPMMTWTGAYIGIHGGAIRQEATGHDLDDFPQFTASFGSINFPRSVTQSGTGGLVGGHIGYNWQSRSFVLGIEADFAGVFGADATSSFTLSPTFPEFVQTHQTEMRWLSTVRLRAGVDYQGTLAYITAGLAVAGIRNRMGTGFTDGSGNTPVFAFQFEDSGTRFGWAVGGGIEHRFGTNWSARVEGLYVDLGRSTATTTAISSGLTDIATLRAQWENTAVLARGGVTYHW